MIATPEKDARDAAAAWVGGSACAEDHRAKQRALYSLWPDLADALERLALSFHGRPR